MADLFENPMGTDGFEFVEYCHTNPQELETLFTSLGFKKTGVHKSKKVTLWQQGDINFILNAEPEALEFAKARNNAGGAMAMAFRVKDAAKALAHAKEKGVKEVTGKVGPGELTIPAIEGIGGSVLYLVDRYGDKGSIYEVDFDIIDKAPNPGAGLTYIDHLTHNVNRGNMAKWADFYTDLFNFREIRYFDIEGKLTGLKSKAMTSPCGKIRIPINESSDDKSQIEEFLKRYAGEGIQHIALGTAGIYDTVRALEKTGIDFQETPGTYYEKVDTRVPGHGEDLKEMQALNILVDGAPTEGQGLLLQIFTKDAIGPIFYEIIQRKGNEGFGEGNFQALFESLEEDQIRRGVLKPEDAKSKKAAS
ncbi:MAG: 4-hydroxyphenylpyruvate dioxygenase [Alphaproteobacteria bacterium]|nr:4-hydroxyphenylpyruvate dioxygenase [Alphaproteobacteria bacterium]